MNLGQRDSYRAYAAWLPADHRIVVVVDRDGDDCYKLKKRLENAALQAGFSTRTQAGASCWQLVNRIAIEELEAWYFGDWRAVEMAFPKVQYSINRKEKFRDPDAITQTWEAFERVLKGHGYFQTGLRKIKAARTLGALVERERTSSRSFTHFCDAILEAAT